MNVQMSMDETLVYLGTVGIDIKAKSELEAVFKATQWVAREKGLI